MFKYHRLDKEPVMAQHLGVFRKRITLFEAVALIVAGTIGAGVLGLPYAIAKVGTLIGIVYLLVIGSLMIGFNYLLGEIIVRTKDELHLVGLAKKYLGKPGQWLMTLLVYVVVFGILDVYIIGEGESLSVLFGGTNIMWSLIFWAIGTCFVFLGLRLIKILDFFLSIIILAVILLISLISAPHVQLINFSYNNFASLLFPFGVILFSFAASGSVVEAHSLLAGDKEKFKNAIFFAGIICIIAYLLFVVAVLGVTGRETTEIATIGLGNKIGKSMFFFGNIFAALAMATCYITLALQFRHSLSWDYKFSKISATSIACGIPLIIYLLGFRSFILMIDLVGGIFLTAEMLLILIIYWRAKQKGDLPVGKYKLHHVYLLVALLVLMLLVGMVYSVGKLF